MLYFTVNNKDFRSKTIENVQDFPLFPDLFKRPAPTNLKLFVCHYKRLHFSDFHLHLKDFWYFPVTFSTKKTFYNLSKTQMTCAARRLDSYLLLISWKVIVELENCFTQRILLKFPLKGHFFINLSEFSITNFFF